MKILLLAPLIFFSSLVFTTFIIFVSGSKNEAEEMKPFIYVFALAITLAIYYFII